MKVTKYKIKGKTRCPKLILQGQWAYELKTQIPDTEFNPKVSTGSHHTRISG